MWLVIGCVSSKSSPARVAAAHVLLRIAQDERAFLTETVDAEIQRLQLTAADARLATAIGYGALRNALLLDAQYRPFLKQSPSKLPLTVRILLRMAVYQKLFLDKIPDHAIANETVELAKQLRVHAREVGFLNAVVRKIVQLTNVRDVPARTASERLSIKYSHPVWLVEYLQKKFGPETAEQIVRANNAESELTLRLNPLAASADRTLEALQKLGATIAPGKLSPGAVVVTELPVQALVTSDLFQSGAVYLQDEGSQLVAHLVAPQPKERVLDMCAAPGGKTTHLAELSGGRAVIIATDVSEARLEQLKENVTRLGTRGVQVIALDDLLGSKDLRATFDAVLVDAPCSGLGTLKRNPEIRYRVTHDHLVQLGRQQLQILDSAAEFVRPGGRLVYSTCTISDEENEHVLNAFLQAHSDYQMALLSHALAPAIAALRGADGVYRTWPAHLHADGFEAAILQRACPSNYILPPAATPAAASAPSPPSPAAIT